MTSRALGHRAVLTAFLVASIMGLAWGRRGDLVRASAAFEPYRRRGVAREGTVIGRRVLEGRHLLGVALVRPSGRGPRRTVVVEASPDVYEQVREAASVEVVGIPGDFAHPLVLKRQLRRPDLEPFDALLIVGLLAVGGCLGVRVFASRLATDEAVG